MTDVFEQPLPEGQESPAALWDKESAQHALDDLFSVARQFKSTHAYNELLEFVARFRFYFPFNAMLIHIQMPGARYVAPASRWRRDYRRRIKDGSRPIVILQPMSPVLFVFDVIHTEPLAGAPPLPRYVERPFEVVRGTINQELERTTANARRDGIDIVARGSGSQLAGSIRWSREGEFLEVEIRARPEYRSVRVPKLFEVEVNANLSDEARYATLVHELGHLYCGHLGTPNERWWPDRRGLNRNAQEYEAESVCYLVCERLGIENRSAEYLSGYMANNAETPPISLECVMKAAGLVEQMGRVRLRPRDQREQAQ